MGLKESGLRGSLRSVSTGVSAIPDSVVNRWPIQEGSGTTITDVVGNSDLSFVGDPQWTSSTDWIEGWAVTLDGTNDGAEGSPTAPAGAMTMVQTVDFDPDITTIQDAGGFNNSGATVNSTRVLRFRGDQSPNRITFTVRNDSEAVTEVAHDLPSAGRYRIGGYLNPSSSEIGIAVDGTVQNTAAVSGSFTEQLSTYAIGQLPGGSDFYFGGAVDEPMVANEGWSSSQFQNDYDRQPWSA